jgi:hypothetical protein
MSEAPLKWVQGVIHLVQPFDDPNVYAYNEGGEMVGFWPNDGEGPFQEVATLSESNVMLADVLRKSNG